MNTEIEKTYDNYFGRCPECGGTNGFLNIGRAHVFICDEHKLAWFAGENLFRCWKDETDDSAILIWPLSLLPFGPT